MPEAFKHDFDGACIPKKGVISTYKTFSVGVFQWLPKSRGKGLKRGPVKVRVSGLCRASTVVFATARGIVEALDENRYSGPRNVNVFIP